MFQSAECSCSAVKCYSSREKNKCPNEEGWKIGTVAYERIVNNSDDGVEETVPGFGGMYFQAFVSTV